MIMRTLAAIENKFMDPLWKDSEYDEDDIFSMTFRDSNTNTVQNQLKDLENHWSQITLEKLR
jgi:hypothetical protein